MKKKNILFINGIPDDKKVAIHTILKDGRIGWGTSGSANIADFIENDFFNRSMVTFDTNPEQDIELDNIHAVFNHIADADSHKTTLEKVENFYKSVSGKVPFFNPPANILKTTRDNIYQLLQGIDKLHVPKTVRIQPKLPSDIYNTIEKEDFKYPIIFRQAGDHGGVSTILIEDATEEFYAFPLDGRDYYLTQFVDYADEDGIYAKYRLIVVGGEVFIRHAIFGKEWMVHGSNQIEKEESSTYKQPIADSFIEKIKPLIQPTITEVYNYLGLDYFGIDCYIDNEMNLLIFEINANMRVSIIKNPEKNEFKQHVDMIRQALIKILST
ncbi:ATP-grasp domain-containing protein [Sulfurovum riftiae]|uniref:ATP-grasp domain-containing protein n=1 Tax=Sulfurovum riftiae TaxID=1630136 RepID=A0A151CJB9_9BACT|nr:hypothetical protein [Sulfurovum riftiae]KYJ87632.1 hypothetical protein AS592_11075 [Sulfurovum riftiae]